MNDIRQDIKRVQDSQQRAILTAFADANIGTIAWNTFASVEMIDGERYLSVSSLGMNLFKHIRNID